MSTQFPEGIRSLLVSSFENCTHEKAQQLVGNYSSTPFSQKTICLGKEEGERDQGFLIRHVESPKKFDTRFLMINDLFHFPDPQRCLVITYDAASNRVKGYQQCPYVKDISMATSKEESAIECYAPVSVSHRFARIVAYPILCAVAYLFRHSSAYSSMIHYRLELNSSLLDMHPKLLRLVQIGFTSFEELSKSATVPRRNYLHMILFETYTFQAVKGLIFYGVVSMFFSWILMLFYSILTHLS